MPLFRVEAIEKFCVRTVYTDVEADTKEEAEERCRTGQESYDSKEILDDDEEWLQTVSVEEQDDTNTYIVPEKS